MAPMMAAWWPSSFRPLPAKKAAPPLENCTTTGAFALAAASSTALMESVPTTLTAGRANSLALAMAKIFCMSSPLTTFGLTTSKIFWDILLLLLRLLSAGMTRPMQMDKVNSALGSLLEHGHRRQGLAFHKLEEGATTGGNIGDLILDAEQIDGRQGIATAGDGESLALGNGPGH